MVERIKNYINGKWVDSKSGETFRSINPANKDEVVGIVAKSDREDVERLSERPEKPMTDGD